MAEEALDPQLLEQRLNQIRGIVSARVIVGEDGEIGEVHVLATSQRPPKHIVRDIESFTLVHFKKRLDYRKISVVQVEGRKMAPVGRIRFKEVRRELSATGQKVMVSVEYDRKEYTGQWEGPTTVSQLEGACLATLKSIEQFLGPNLGLVLKEAKIAKLQERPVAIVSVATRTTPGDEALLGTSFVRDSVSEAAAKAILNALNRRLPFTAE
jgi:hypothetical protein